MDRAAEGAENFEIRSSGNPKRISVRDASLEEECSVRTIREFLVPLVKTAGIS